MKNLVKLCFFLWIVSIGSCKKEDSSNALTGKWKLTESYAGTGSSSTDKWKPVDSKTNLYVQFNSDGSLGGNNYYPTYISYVIKDNKILTFYKSDGTYEDFTYNISNRSLTLSPAGPIFCIEGCASRYTKVTS